MKRIKKSILVMVGAVFMLFAAQITNASNIDIGTSVFFTNGLSINNVVDFDYGIIEYSASGSAANIVMDPADGSIACSDTVNYECPASGTRGSFFVAGSVGQTVEIGCQKGGKVSNGVDWMRYNQSKINVGGSISDCNGQNNVVATHTLTGNMAADTMYLGARLRVKNGGVPAPGVYLSTNPGGNEIRVKVLYQ